MKRLFKVGFKGTWLLISLLALALPVFLPSYSNPQTIFQNIIGVASVTMFFISFPMSLLGLPVGFFTSRFLGLDPASIGGMYVSLLALFAMGFIQWFVLVPRLLKGKPLFQILDLPGTKPKALLAEAKFEDQVNFYDSQGRTPVERIIRNGSDDRSDRS